MLSRRTTIDRYDISKFKDLEYRRLFKNKIGEQIRDVNIDRIDSMNGKWETI